MSATPGILATTGHLAIFTTICVASVHFHVYKRMQSLWKPRTVPTEHDACPKVVVLTGCDRGFGRLLAEKLLASSDYIVVALTLTAEAAKELNALASTTGKLKAVKCDVTSDEDVKHMKDYVEKILVTEKAVLYGIVNNAGIADPGDFVWFADNTTLRKVMDVNFFGTANVTQALLPLVLRTSPTLSNGARILNLSSVCGTTASPGNSAYNASKFAVEAFSDSLRIELGPFNVHVSKIRPGQISTQIQSDYIDNLLKNYAKAPATVRDLYGGDEYAAKVSKTFEAFGASDNMAKPSLVVDSLTDLLAKRGDKLKAAYWIGSDAHTLWRALHTLPTAVTDSVKRGVLHIAPILQKSKV